MSTTATPKPVKLAEPKTITIRGARIVKERGRGIELRHLLLPGETKTACGIDAADLVNVAKPAPGYTNCPACIKALAKRDAAIAKLEKAAAAKAA